MVGTDNRPGWRRGVVVSGVRQWTKLTHVGPGYNWDWWPSSSGYTISGSNQPTRSTQPCIPPGSVKRVPASVGVTAGMSPLPGGRWSHMACEFPVAVRRVANCYTLFTLLYLFLLFIYLMVHIQWCIAKNAGGYTQTGVAKGLKVGLPCLFMITEVSIRCQKNPGGWYAPYTPPNTPLFTSYDMTRS